MTLANQLEVRGKVRQATIYFASEKTEDVQLISEG